MQKDNMQKDLEHRIICLIHSFNPNKKLIKKLKKQLKSYEKEKYIKKLDR